MPKLRIQNLLGREWISVEMSDFKKDSDWMVTQGYRRYIPLTPEQVALPLDLLIKMYKAGIFTDEKPAETVSYEKQKALEALIILIKTSIVESDVAAAKEQYQKLTGKPWIDV